MMPKSTATSRRVIVDEQIARMHVGVKEAVAQRVAEKCLDQRAGELRQVEALGDETCAVRQRRGVDPFQRQDFLGGAIPIDRRHAEIRIVLGVLGHFRERRRLEAEIHFDRDRAAQRVDDFDEPQPPRLGGKLFGVARHEREGAQIGVEAPLDAGTQHLDGDRPVDRPQSRLRRDGPARSRRPRPADRMRRKPHSAACLTMRPPPPRPPLAETAASGPAAAPGRLASAAPTTSGRVARNWPSLT